eukprot:9134952-Pyramimonas_sp.AAC.1
MRMNYAPTAGFEADVGHRTSFDFINQQHTKAFIPRVRTGGQVGNPSLCRFVAAGSPGDPGRSA